ncbi:hypothetical protein ABTZ58_38915 [Streptomyces sp. NPDC094143]|uniref:hypothetical protein n=1 Tax=Streptomyces sp. NPDC094143 TaxID=3155310 RepID=UPI0033256777
MANGVWHEGLQRVLALDKDDLDLPRGSQHLLPDLIDALLRPITERDRTLLQCVESQAGRVCKAELNGVQSRFMYVRRHRGPDGLVRLRAVHLPTTHEMTPEESDRHKAMKEFVARTCDAAGIRYDVEKANKFRTSRPDVTVIGDGGLNLGCEAQYYNASSGTVLRRSRAHASAGLTANWITDNDKFHLVDRANWMLTRPATWRQISNATDLPLMGGYRVLVEWICTAAAERPCPDGLAKTGCGRVHLQWDTPRRLDDEGTGWTGWTGSTRGVTVGQTLIGAATGTVVPLFIPSQRNRHAGAYMWVPARDRATWSEYRPIEEPPAEGVVEPGDAIHFSGEEAELSCRFGEETWTPSAPLPRRGLAQLSITVDRPQHPVHLPAAEFAGTAQSVPPGTPRPRPGEYETGASRCGEAARPTDPPVVQPADSPVPAAWQPAQPASEPTPATDAERAPQDPADTRVPEDQPDSNARTIPAMAETSFPGDLLAAQTRLHQATAELSVLLQSLPWSAEPMEGWPGTEHPHTGEVTGGRAPSPGWTDEQKAAVAQLRQECLELSETVTAHPYWEGFQAADVVKERMRLKAASRAEVTVTTAGLGTVA